MKYKRFNANIIHFHHKFLIVKVPNVLFKNTVKFVLIN